MESTAILSSVVKNGEGKGENAYRRASLCYKWSESSISCEGLPNADNYDEQG